MFSGLGKLISSKIKVAQNVLKHILFLEFLKSDKIFECSHRCMHGLNSNLNSKRKSKVHREINIDL